MSSQGTTPRDDAGDAWWDTVYQGPRDAVPDTPLARTGQGSVDEWFDAALGVVAPEPEPGPDAGAPEGPPGAAGSGSVDEWFDVAAGVIGDGHAGAGAPAAGASGGGSVDEWFDVAAGVVAEERAAAGAPGGDGWGAPLPPLEAPAGEAAGTAGTVPRTAVLPGQRERGDQGAAAPAAEPIPHVGDRPPTYDAEPSALPPADPEHLAELVPDTVVEGAHYAGLTLRAAGVRGDSARYRGEPRRDALLVARFGEPPDGVVVAVVAAAPRSAEIPSSAAAEACRRLAATVGRSRAELVADLRAGAHDGLRFGLRRLAARAAQHLNPAAPAPGPEGQSDPRDPRAPAAAEAQPGSLHCLLVPLDPAVTDRACFGTGPGGLFLLRAEDWDDAYGDRPLHRPDGRAADADAPDPAFRFRMVAAAPGDVLLLATPGFADPVREEPAVARFLADHWSQPHPPGTVDFLRQIQVRAKGYADDRTAVVLWTG